MKKVFPVLVFLVLGMNSTFAQDAPGPATAGSIHPFYLGIGTGAVLPGNNWDPDYYLGGGGLLFAGYRIDPRWSGQLTGEQWFFTGGGSSLYNLRLGAEVKYSFEGKGWQPYLLAGPGLVFQKISPSGDSTTNFDALGGVGVQFDLTHETHLFVQTEYNFIMSQTTIFTDLPITGGLWAGL